MGRFNVAAWSPQDDSTPNVDYAKIGVNPETNVVLVQPTADHCPCGCGTKPASKGRTFAMGHDARLRGKLIRAHLTGTPVVVVVGDTVHGPGTAVELAHRHGWQHYLTSAEKKQGASIRAKIEASSHRVAAAVLGPQIGDRVPVKVGRWEYTGQIMAIFHDGSRYEVEYVTKKGDLVRTEVPADKVAGMVKG